MATENIWEIDLARFLTEPLDVAEGEISSKLAGIDSPTCIRIPSGDRRAGWQMYKDIVSFLITLTSEKMKLISDPATYELCWEYTGGNLSGDPQTGYFLNIR